jgi:hypothetical protein
MSQLGQNAKASLRANFVRSSPACRHGFCWNCGRDYQRKIVGEQMLFVIDPHWPFSMTADNRVSRLDFGQAWAGGSTMTRTITRGASPGPNGAPRGAARLPVKFGDFGKTSTATGTFSSKRAS